jgi:alkaline phosphatase D
MSKVSRRGFLAQEDGGPLVYRARHSVKLWTAGERPELRQEVVEGDAGTSV